MADREAIIDGYRLVDRITTSKTSQIWEVVDTRTSQSLTMKLLLPQSFNDPQCKQAIRHEARVLKSLDHRNIIKFQSVAVSKRHAYLVTELFRAPDLKSRLLNDPVGVQLGVGKLVPLACLALSHVHERGWIHKDVKPDNILFNRASELRLIDFSVSSRVSSGVVQMLRRKSKAIQGTRTYIAPELIRREPPTPKADMYSFGVMLFELVTGVPPFIGSDPKDLLAKHLNFEPPKPSQINPNVTSEMDEFVLRMIKKNPEHRFSDMNAVLQEFRGLSVFHENAWEYHAKLGKTDDRNDLGDTRGPASQPEPPSRRTEPSASSVTSAGGEDAGPKEDDLPFWDDLPPVV